MKNPFKYKKNHIPKEARLEMKRREDLVKKLYEIVLECPNAQDMKTRVEVINNQINAEGSKRVKMYQDELGNQTFNTLELKVQEGKGSEIEQKILDLFVDEKISTTQTILQTWIISMDAFIRKDMLEREAKSLKIEFKD